MARTAQKVGELVDQDASMRAAIRVVLARDEEGEVTWSAVRDELTSGQWGRLIETGILVEGDGDGFRVADPEAAQQALDGGTSGSSLATSSLPDEPPESDTGWSTWDKLAGLAALALFPGYYFPSVRNVLGGALDNVFGPIDALLPFYAVIMVLAVLTGLYSTLLQANLMDMDRMSYYQARMKDIQNRQKEAKERGDEEAIEKIREEQMEAMGDQMGMMKAQFRPMVWIMLLTIPVFLWMYWKLLAGHVVDVEMTIIMPLVGTVGLLDGAIGPIPAWILWYFLCSMGFSQIIRKSLNVQTTPT